MMQDGALTSSPVSQFKSDKTVSGDITQCRVAFDSSLGFDQVDKISERRRARTIEEGVPYPVVDVSLLLPDTMMNLSGTAARKFVDKHKFRLKKNPSALNRGDELLVVYDDIDLPFGKIKWKSRGGHGGQNGVRDIIKRLGTDRFARMRIGVGPANGMPISGDAAKYVLGRFNADEQAALDKVLRLAGEHLRVYLHRGIDAASAVANGGGKKKKKRGGEQGGRGKKQQGEGGAKRARR